MEAVISVLVPLKTDETISALVSGELTCLDRDVISHSGRKLTSSARVTFFCDISDRFCRNVTAIMIAFNSRLIIHIPEFGHGDTLLEKVSSLHA